MNILSYADVRRNNGMRQNARWKLCYYALPVLVWNLPTTHHQRQMSSVGSTNITASLRQRGDVQYTAKQSRKKYISEKGRCLDSINVDFYNEDNDYYIFNEAKRPKI